MRLRMFLCFASVFVLGCGSKQYAPVSGRVTLNGQPLANATVTFQPFAQEGSIEAGPGSSGKTDANGEYSLTAVNEHNGAWVGKNHVMISLPQTTKDSEDDSRPRRGGPLVKERVPKRYNAKSTLTYEVVRRHNNADFDLRTP